MEDITQKQKRVQASFRLHPETVKDLKLLAARDNTSQGRVIDDAVDTAMAAWGEPSTTTTENI